MKHLTISVILYMLLLNCSFSQWQQNVQNKIPGIIDVDPLTMMQTDHPSGQKFKPKSTIQYSAFDWQNAIDSTWGPGLPTSDKLLIFDKFWNRIDSSFACFNHIQDNWVALKNLYRPEIAAGVSKGRFAAIMNVLSFSLMELHTNPMDATLINNMVITPGTPFMLIGGWGSHSQFGAGLTPLPDSSLLVYKVIPNHPLGLQPGDIVLGYEGIPWKVLIYQLLDNQLPFAGVIGSSPSAFTHSLLMAAGRNRHLFETIDIIKYSTGDTLHLSTAPLYGLPAIFGDEQMVIPGVPKPDINAGQYVSYGIVQGTNIGYIYGIQWSGNAGQQFYNAVQALMGTSGLIIDFRTNFGGNMFLSDSALKVLFSSEMVTIDWGRRTSPSNHLQMTLNNVSANYKIKGTPPGYLKPIAVLTGPGAGSSGDQVAFRMKFHPRVKIFGKPTNGAFNSPTTLNLHPDWVCRYPAADAYDLASGRYLTHLEFPVDQSVWLTKEGVAQGRDDVVEAAMGWINVFSGAEATIFTDNAEGGFGKWVTNQGWAVFKGNAHSPVNSFTDGKSNYKNNADNSMTLKNPVNVSGKDAVVLSFWHRYATQLDKDFCRVEVSSNNGSTWQEAVKYSGNISTIHEAKIDITKYTNNSSSVKIRFRLTSDASVVADGWYVDDVLITGYTSSGMNITDGNELNSSYSYKLNQNYPNPFNPSTTINFTIPRSSFTSLKVYDILGREVSELISSDLNAGSHSLTFNGDNLASGIYYYRLESSGNVAVKKMLLIK
jgi:hypothetical protein